MSESGLFCGEFVPISHPLLATIHPHCPPNIQLNTRKCASNAEPFAKVWISCLVWEQLPAMAREEEEEVEEEEMDKGEEEGIIRFDSTGWAEHPPAVNKIKDNIFNCKYLLMISKNIFWWSPKIFSENWSVALSASGADLLVIDSRAMLGAWRLFPSSLSSFVALKSWKETTRLNWTVMMWTDSILTFLP